MARTTEFGGAPGSIIRFGPFELDLRSAELRKNGIRIRIQEQPFQILQILLEHQGQTVLREDIQKKLWPNNTIVEFDHRINAAVAEKPRYVETVARRGYRFIAAVEMNGSVPTQQTEPARETQPVQERSRWHVNPWILIPVALAAVGVWASAEYYKRTRLASRPTLQPLMRLDVDLGGGASPNSDRAPSAVISPDGTRLVYVSQSKLFVRQFDQLDQANSTELPGTERGEGPFFSPDGQWVGFTADGKLKKVPVGGGPVVELCSGPGRGGSWGEDGNIMFALNFTLSRVPSTGGTPAEVTGLAPGEVAHRWPQILRGGKAVLFTAYRSPTGAEGATIEVLSFRERRRKTLVRGGTFGRYLASGHLTYIDKGTLYAVPFDPDRLEVHGTATPVLQDVEYSTAWGFAHVDVGRTGTVVYRSSRAPGDLVTVEWMDESGNTTPLLAFPGNYSFPTFSPDGNRLALISAGDIWVYELRRGSMTRLTLGGGCSFPAWTIDGRYIVFRSARGMVWTRADGTGQPEVLSQSSNPQNPQSFTPNGKRLAFVELSPATGADIWTMPVEIGASGLRAGKSEVFLQSSYHERGPVFSPDGRWLAYMSNESGDYRVYVDAFPNKGAKRQVTPDGTSGPIWSRNGKDLFFVQFRARQLMTIPYKDAGGSFETGKPLVWSRQIALFTAARSYDPAPDGKRVIVLMPADAPQAAHDRLIFLLNFFDELRRRVALSNR
jgi:serine/threonine-protein kinase